VALFDNEEVGSESYQGAGSSMMSSIIGRIVGDPSRLDSAIAKSFLISADMAHALHPNYTDKHEDCHRPQLHRGLVIKENANQRYATSSVTAFVLQEVARRHQLPTQRFAVRNDMGCGSTIGPILSSNTSIRTIDVGLPQFAMHSIRETMGTVDVWNGYALLKAIYTDFPIVDRQLKTDE